MYQFHRIQLSEAGEVILNADTCIDNHCICLHYVGLRPGDPYTAGQYCILWGQGHIQIFSIPSVE